MTASTAKRYVILAAVLAAGITTARSITVAGQAPSSRVYVGVFVMALILSLMAEMAPAVAGGFAALIIVSTLLSGGDVWTAIADLTTRTEQ